MFFLVTSLFQRLAVTEVSVRGTDRPRIDIRALSEGRPAAHDLTVGTMVQPTSGCPRSSTPPRRPMSPCRRRIPARAPTAAAASTDGAGAGSTGSSLRREALVASRRHSCVRLKAGRAGPDGADGQPCRS
ncbi:MAG: hypothetical protein R3D03_13505 [Geminicoccaceae bacterium]